MARDLWLLYFFFFLWLLYLLYVRISITVGDLLLGKYSVFETGTLCRQEVNITGSECVGLFFSYSSWYDAFSYDIRTFTACDLMQTKYGVTIFRNYFGMQWPRLIQVAAERFSSQHGWRPQPYCTVQVQDANKVPVHLMSFNSSLESKWREQEIWFITEFHETTTLNEFMSIY